MPIPAMSRISMFALVLIAGGARGAEAKFGHPHPQIYFRHCTQSDYFQAGMTCKEDLPGSTQCESFDKTMVITSWVNGKPNSQTCAISTWHKINPPCVPDPAAHGSTCGNDAAMSRKT